MTEPSGTPRNTQGNTPGKKPDRTREATTTRKVAKAAGATRKVAKAAGAEVSGRPRSRRAARPAGAAAVVAGDLAGDLTGSGPAPPWPGPRLRAGRARSAALYDRRIQRRHERWPLTARMGFALLSRPELVLSLLGRPAPIAVDGRVLDRGVQALLAVADRAEAHGAPGAGMGEPFEPHVMRRQLTSMARAVMPVRTDVHVTGRLVPPGRGPSIPLRVYRRYGSGFESARGRRPRPPAIVYYHGGGWVTGSLDSHDASCRLLAAASGCIVVSADYRLAPEHPFPAAVDDALAAYRWVHVHADELGSESGQVGVMGDSAGGNLAAVVALAMRRGGADGVPPPIAQVLVYPAVDAHFDSGSYLSMAEGFFLTRELMEFYWGAYLPNDVERESAEASPLRADDHAGAAPALVVTAGFDPLRDEGASYADALRAAGVDVDYRCYDDQVHGFMGMGVLPGSLALASEVSEAAGRLMRRSASLHAP